MRMTNQDNKIRVGIIGFGVAGEFFHGAFLADDPGYEIVGIVTRSQERAARADSLGPVVQTVDELLALAPDLVVVASPPTVHREHALAALAAGADVVVDKPFAPNVDDARAIIEAAKSHGRLLTVFQNRRFDRDFVTLKRLAVEGVVGDVHTFESRFEWWKPEVDESWKSTTSADDGGGILLDLGPHLVDQAIELLGPVTKVRSATVRQLRDGATADDDAFIELEHASGAVSRLTMSALVGSMGQRFRLAGSRGILTIDGLDEQENSLRTGGARPSDPGFRSDSRRLQFSAGEQEDDLGLDEGSYADFYGALATAIRYGADVPLSPDDALAVLRILETVRERARR